MTDSAEHRPHETFAMGGMPPNFAQVEQHQTAVGLLDRLMTEMARRPDWTLYPMTNRCQRFRPRLAEVDEIRPGVVRRFALVGYR